MAKTKKTVFKSYFVWNYEREIEDLNRASEQGWQLVKGGNFHSRFVKDDSVRYRYQLDASKLDTGRLQDVNRYLDSFREQGWEYINSTFNGWNYFRKPYDPNLPESAYEIYTDRESLREMNRRWARMLLTFAALLGLGAVYYLRETLLRPCQPSLVMLLALAAESLVLLYGGLQMRNVDSGHRRRGRGLAAVFVAFLLVGLIGGTVLRSLRAYQWCEIDFGYGNSAAEQDHPSESMRHEHEHFNDFEVHYADQYYLDLELEGSSPIDFSLLSETGDVVYTRSATELQEKNLRLRLVPGHYWFSMTTDAGRYHMRCEIR